MINSSMTNQPNVAELLSGKPVSTWLPRLIAVNTVAIYAGIVSLLHWLKTMPIYLTWIGISLGIVLVFLALGLVLTGRVWGFFSNTANKVRVDWLPILLICPLGFSLWTCIALGVESMQARQQVTDGLGLSIVLVVSLGLPLLLARIAAPATPETVSHNRNAADIQYVMASIVAALLIALAIFQALRVDIPLHQQGMTGMNKPAVMQGFQCNENATPTDPNDENAQDNRCPPETTTAIKSSNQLLPSTTKINQTYLTIAASLLLISGLALVANRQFGAMKGKLTNPTNNPLLAELAHSAEQILLSKLTPAFNDSGLPDASLVSKAVEEKLATNQEAAKLMSMMSGEETKFGLPQNLLKKVETSVEIVDPNLLTQAESMLAQIPIMPKQVAQVAPLQTDSQTSKRGDASPVSGDNIGASTTMSVQMASPEVAAQIEQTPNMQPSALTPQEQATISPEVQQLRTMLDTHHTATVQLQSHMDEMQASMEHQAQILNQLLDKQRGNQT